MSQQSNNEDKPAPINEDIYVPENNNSSNIASSIFLVIWYLFIAAAGIVVLGVVALFVVCMV